jgi:hypothetical protein
MTIDTRTSQQVIDDAVRKVQQGSTDEAKQGAQKSQEAFDRNTASTGDSQVMNAGKNIQADYRQQVASSRTWDASSVTTEQANRGEQAQETGRFGSKVDLDREIGQALIDHYGSVMNMLRARTNNPREFNQTAQRIAQEVAQRYKALSQEGLNPVTPRGDVERRAENNVNVLGNLGQGQARQAAEQFRNWVRSQQHAPPEQPPDQSKARDRHEEGKNAAEKELSELKEQTMVKNGAAAAAAELYKLDQMGAGTLLKNAFLFGYGYQSPTQIEEDLRRLAARDPEVKAALILGSTGGFDPNTASGKDRLDLLARKLTAPRMPQPEPEPPTGGPGYNAP